MPYKDINKQREAIRKSVAKHRAKQKGITSEKVKPSKPKEVKPQIVKPKSQSKTINNQLLETFLNEIKQIKEQNNLFHYELSEYFQEKENQQLRISQLEQTISELQSQNQTLIKTISEKKSESKTEEKNTIKKPILTPQLRKQLKKETANMVK